MPVRNLPVTTTVDPSGAVARSRPSRLACTAPFAPTSTTQPDSTPASMVPVSFVTVPPGPNPPDGAVGEGPAPAVGIGIAPLDSVAPDGGSGADREDEGIGAEDPGPVVDEIGADPPDGLDVPGEVELQPASTASAAAATAPASLATQRTPCACSIPVSHLDRFPDLLTRTSSPGRCSRAVRLQAAQAGVPAAESVSVGGTTGLRTTDVHGPDGACPAILGRRRGPVRGAGGTAMSRPGSSAAALAAVVFGAVAFGAVALGACSAPDVAPPVADPSPSAAIAADTRPVDPHETMTAMSMSATPAAPAVATLTGQPPAPATPAPVIDVLPGMPPVTDPHNIYAAAGVNMLGPAAQRAKAYAYVPHSKSGDVWVIDTQTFQVVDKFPVGVEAQHVVPSYDMSSLYATDDIGNVIRRIDPFTGQAGEKIPVTDPYNMYFTPDGRYAISVAEALRTLIWYDPVSWQELDRVRFPDCKGIDHGDFTPDGKIAVFSCEFDGRVAVVDLQTHQLIRMVDMPVRNTTMGPQDLRIAPDGSKFYIADSDSDGVWVLDKDLQTVTRHIDTGDGAHGLYFSRDASKLYVTNRHEGSISVLDAYTGEKIATWRIPGGGSPDMGNVSADGGQLWLSGRYDSVVYVLNTADGSLIAKIAVGNGPHGLALMPQPGRYSIGHTGITR